MAQIAEELMALLLDNAAGRPALDRARRRRILAGAVLLDLARLCRIRPAGPHEPTPGRLIALQGPDPRDPVLGPALHLVQRRPVTPAAAVARTARDVESILIDQLTRTGQVVPTRRRRVGGLGGPPAWPLTDRTRVERVRAEVLGALFDRRRPDACAAAIISLLHAVDGLGALLSLNDRGWRWVHDRASEIAAGSWVDSNDAEVPDVNVAITLSAVRPALA